MRPPRQAASTLRQSSPTSSGWPPSRARPPVRAGVNRMMDVIVEWFTPLGARCSAEKIDPRFGDMVRVTDPARSGPGILVLSHLDTVHPIGTLASICRSDTKATGSTAPACST